MITDLSLVLWCIAVLVILLIAAVSREVIRELRQSKQTADMKLRLAEWLQKNPHTITAPALGFVSRLSADDHSGIVVAHLDRQTVKDAMQAMIARSGYPLVIPQSITLVPGRPFHTMECWQLQLKLRDLRDAWLLQWPDYCKTCEAAGELVDYENGAPHGSGEVWPMPVVQWCHDCIDADRCPRCGVHWIVDDEWHDLISGGDVIVACQKCGWTGKGSTDRLPPVWDGCGCQEGVTE